MKVGRITEPPINKAVTVTHAYFPKLAPKLLNSTDFHLEVLFFCDVKREEAGEE